MQACRTCGPGAGVGLGSASQACAPHSPSVARRQLPRPVAARQTHTAPAQTYQVLGESAAQSMAAYEDASSPAGGPSTVKGQAGASDVPSSLGGMGGALAIFLRHPTPALILAGLTIGAYARASGAEPAGTADAAVAALVAAWWLLQEWLVHSVLLHSSFDWPGKAIHHGHHLAPYYHVSIDGPGLILPAMACSAAFFWAALAGLPSAMSPAAAGSGGQLWLTATLAYWAMGLLYEWTHFIVHTRVVPRSALGRAVRRNHMLHHNRNEAFWLSFMAPGVDGLLGTAPRPGTVPVSELARQGFRQARR